MCGLFGIAFTRATAVPDERKLRASAQALEHRGPDSQAVYSDRGIGLVHARLSLLDPDPRSDQPLWDETGRYAIVYNGEIYNFRELRSFLEARGVTFRTTSDTEVLLKCLIHRESTEVIRELEGMFAFAFFDSKARTLTLARDRFGMKPLYVYECDEFFMFASETKAFRSWLDIDVDRFSVASYLLKFRGPTKGFTFLGGVQSVTPGGIIVKELGAPSARSTYCTLDDFLDAGTISELGAFSSDRMVDHMDELLLRSVRSHQFADVPIGAFCSGGVDSSVLMAMASRTCSNLAIFHANVKGRWSEYDAALALSKHLRLDLQTVDVVEQDFIDALPRVMKHYEYPFADRPNCVPLMMVAQLARDKNVKGLLSGEGSDECFLGYPWLGRKRITDTYYRTGDRLRAIVHRIPGLGPIVWPHEGNNAEGVRSLMNRREIADDEKRIRRTCASIAGAKVPYQSEWTLDYLHHHLRTLLHRNDTMGMAAGIEARFPFLDHQVVRAAVNMPGHFKLRFSPGVLDKAHPFICDKWVVRRVADRYLPRTLSRRKKFGFWTTAFERMEISVRYFEDSYIGSLFGLTNSQMRDAIEESDAVFRLRLFHLDLWGKICVEQRPEDACVSMLREHVRIRSE